MKKNHRTSTKSFISPLSLQSVFKIATWETLKASKSDQEPRTTDNLFPARLKVATTTSTMTTTVTTISTTLGKTYLDGNADNIGPDDFLTLKQKIPSKMSSFD